MAFLNAAMPAPDSPGNGHRTVISCGGCDSSKHSEIAGNKQAAFTDWDFARESDRKFFERFRDRQFCIRPPCLSEVAKLHRLGEPPIPQGAGWFTVVKKITPTCMMRTWIIADEEMVHCDATEDDAAAIWGSLCATSEVRS